MLGSHSYLSASERYYIYIRIIVLIMGIVSKMKLLFMRDGEGERDERVFHPKVK